MCESIDLFDVKDFLKEAFIKIIEMNNIDYFENDLNKWIKDYSLYSKFSFLNY
jgi:hypothetical protein